MSYWYYILILDGNIWDDTSIFNNMHRNYPLILGRSTDPYIIQIFFYEYKSLNMKINLQLKPR